LSINVSYHSGPDSDLESTSRLIVARREYASEVMRLLEELDRRDNKPRLHIVGSSNNRIVVVSGTISFSITKSDPFLKTTLSLS